MEKKKPRSRKKVIKKPSNKLAGLEPESIVIDDTESADRDRVRLLKDGRVALTPELWKMANQLDKMRLEFNSVQKMQDCRRRILDGLYNTLMAKAELECEDLAKHDDEVIGFELLNNGYIRMLFKREYIRQQQQEALKKIPPRVRESLKELGMSDQQITGLFNNPFLNNE